MASPVPQQFCLRWNNHQAALVSVFEHLLQSEAFVDVTLAVEGLFLRAHKLVLSACSPYFQTVFASHPAKHPIIILKDVKYADLRALLDFMYRGEVSVDQDQLSSFLRLAENLRIRGLAEVCDETTSAEAREQQLQEHQRLIFDSLERHRLGLSVDLSPHALLAQSHRSAAAAAAGERSGEDNGHNMDGPLALASAVDRTHGGGASSTSSSALAFASPAALPLFTNPLSLANAAAASSKRPGSPSSLVRGSTVYRRKRGRPARLHSESPSLVPSPLELLESRVETQSSSSSSTPNPQSTSTPGPRPNSPQESNSNAQEDTSAQFDESVKSEDQESPRQWSSSADPVPGTSKSGADEEDESPTRRKGGPTLSKARRARGRGKGRFLNSGRFLDHARSSSSSATTTTPLSLTCSSRFGAVGSSSVKEEDAPNAAAELSSADRAWLAAQLLPPSTTATPSSGNSSTTATKTASALGLANSSGRGTASPCPSDFGPEQLQEMSIRGLDLFRYATVSEEGVYRCIPCEKEHVSRTFKNKYSFQRHAYLYHEGNQRKVFPCLVCGREFSRPDKLKHHLKTVHEYVVPRDYGNAFYSIP